MGEEIYGTTVMAATQWLQWHFRQLQTNEHTNEQTNEQTCKCELAQSRYMIT